MIILFSRVESAFETVLLSNLKKCCGRSDTVNENGNFFIFHQINIMARLQFHFLMFVILLCLI